VRVLVIAALAVLLAGCTDADWDHVMSYVPEGPTVDEETPAVASPAPSTGVSEKAQRECADWATERAGDAANQNFDPDVMQKVHDATYADCMTWAVRLHR